MSPGGYKGPVERPTGASGYAREADVPPARGRKDLRILRWRPCAGYGRCIHCGRVWHSWTETAKRGGALHRLREARMPDAL